FDLLPNGLYCRVRAQKPISQRFVFAQQAKQQVFRLDERTSELTGFVPREEDYSSRLLGITFKHILYRPLVPMNRYLLFYRYFAARLSGTIAHQSRYQTTAFQTHHTVATPGKRQIVSDKD